MIGKIRGNVAKKEAGFILLDVGGIGYKIYVTANAYQTVKEGGEEELKTHLVVREDSLTLFGFTKDEELRLFEMLILVSGIGPKSALAILSLTDVNTLVSAIANGESSYLTKVSGVGRKNAEKIILELKDKLGGEVSAQGKESFTADSEALEALESLGYSIRDAREALKQVPHKIEDMGERLREALKHLSRK